jgi:membrane dipeptidase
MRASTAVLIVLFTSLPSSAPLGPTQADANLVARARQLHREVPLIDGHNDYPWAVRENVPTLDLAALDIRGPQSKTMTDIPRLRAGGVGGQFWSVYVPATLQGQTAVRTTLEQIDIVHRMVARYPDTFEMAGTAADLERIFEAGRIGSMAGVEGGHSIDNSLGVLRIMYGAGARYMTLTHGSNIAWADSATDDPKLGGLSHFGEAVVREMNRLGMLVDLSHTSPETMDDALRVTRAPVIFSHSSARAICDHPRNVPDEVLRRLPANGGVVMVTFVPSFIAPEAGRQYPKTRDALRRLRQQYANDPEGLQRAIDALMKSTPEPKATLSMVADHIDHIREVAGIDHIGIGSDFDGITAVPQGLEDVSTYPALTAELLRRGYADEDVKKILGLNVLRVMRDAERIAGQLQTAEPPSTATLEALDGRSTQ